MNDVLSIDSATLEKMVNYAHEHTFPLQTRERIQTINQKVLFQTISNNKTKQVYVDA